MNATFSIQRRDRYFDSVFKGEKNIFRKEKKKWIEWIFSSLPSDNRTAYRRLSVKHSF